MNRIKEIYTPLLTVVISCFLGVLMVEWTLRFIHSGDPWDRTKEANILRNINFIYDISELYKGESKKIHYIRNQYGLRDSCESISEIDILSVGGSTTDQRYVTLASTYQLVLEKHLEHSIDGFGCVSNAGVDGHSTWGHLFAFEHWFPLLPQLKPKIILLYIGINDADFLRVGPALGFDIVGSGGFKSFFKDLEIFRALTPIYQFLGQSFDNGFAAYSGHAVRKYTDAEYTVNQINDQTLVLAENNAIAFHGRMLKLLDHIASFDALPLCVTQPHRLVKKKDGALFGLKDAMAEGFSGLDYDYSLRLINKMILKVCGENTIDLYNHNFSEEHFYDGVHTTASGSEEIGKEIAKFIIKNGLIQDSKR